MVGTKDGGAETSNKRAKQKFNWWTVKNIFVPRLFCFWKWQTVMFEFICFWLKAPSWESLCLIFYCSVSLSIMLMLIVDYGRFWLRWLLWVEAMYCDGDQMKEIILEQIQLRRGLVVPKSILYFLKIKWIFFILRSMLIPVNILVNRNPLRVLEKHW